MYTNHFLKEKHLPNGGFSVFTRFSCNGFDEPFSIDLPAKGFQYGSDTLLEKLSVWGLRSDTPGANWVLNLTLRIDNTDEGSHGLHLLRLRPDDVRRFQKPDYEPNLLKVWDNLNVPDPLGFRITVSEISGDRQRVYFFVIALAGRLILPSAATVATGREE